MMSLRLMCLMAAAVSLTGGVTVLPTQKPTPMADAVSLTGGGTVSPPQKPTLMADAVSLTGGGTVLPTTQEPTTGSAFYETTPGSGFNEPSPDIDDKDTFADDEEGADVDEWQPYLIRVGLQVPWYDSISQHRCHDVNYLSLTCQQVEKTLGADSTTFIGTIPNDENMVEVMFEGAIERSQFQNISSALHGLIIPDYAHNTQVPLHVNITLLSNTGSSSIYSVGPVVGPRSGGTPVTIKGYGLDRVQEVSIGGHVCNMTNVSTNRSRVLIICTTPELTDAGLVGNKPEITLHRTTNDNTPSGFLFHYVADPTITNIKPTNTILSGGVLLTVNGTNLNTVKIRHMITTATHLNTGKKVSYQTICTGEEPDYMLCPTPALALNDVLKRRRRSKTAKSFNIQYNLRVDISFVMDGVKAFKNLNGTNLQHCSSLTVYANPELNELKGTIRGVTLTFTPIWPVSDESIEIKGEGLLDGLRPEDYQVHIGEDRCTNMKVYSNLIECHPPPRRPQVAEEDRGAYNRIPVKVLYAGLKCDMGYLSYVQTLWEYPPARYTIIGLSAGLLLLLIVFIVVCCICCRWRRYYPLGAVAATAPGSAERDQLELLEEIRLEMSRRDVNNIPKYVSDSNGKHNVTPVTQRAEDRFIKV